MDHQDKIQQTPIQIFLRFLRFGFLAWGGPVAQIAMMRQELVEEEKWVTREKFNRALAVYQVLPGPEAHELCVWFGMNAGGRIGGFLAGLGFMLPGFLLMLGLCWVYFQYGIHSPVLLAVFSGFQVAVIALIFSAVYRIGSHALLNKELIAVAVLSFITTVIGMPFFIVLPAVALAYILWSRKLKLFAVILIAFVVVFGAWKYIPISIVSSAASTVNGQTLPSIQNAPLSDVFFSGLKGGLLTFGGAYTAIPFLQNDAVVEHQWITNEQFLDGIALSGIIPAPLIIFSTFIGFFASGWLGAIVITLGIFLPAFSFTLLGHKVIEKVIENKSLHDFLDGVTAGVIGLIGVTAFQLFMSTITNGWAAVIFMISLLTLFVMKSKYASVMVIASTGILALVYYLIS